MLKSERRNAEIHSVFFSRPNFPFHSFHFISYPFLLFRKEEESEEKLALFSGHICVTPEAAAGTAERMVAVIVIVLK